MRVKLRALGRRYKSKWGVAIKTKTAGVNQGSFNLLLLLDKQINVLRFGEILAGVVGCSLPLIDMGLSIRSLKLTETPGQSGWVQVYEYAPKEEELLSLRGQLSLVVSLQGEEAGIGQAELGRRVLTKLHQAYYDNTKISPFNALKRSIEEGVSEFSTYTRALSISAVSLVKDVVYSAATGGGQVSLYRDKKLATILVSQKDRVISASGYPREGDVLLLGTRTLFSSLQRSVFLKALGQADLESGLEMMTSSLRSNGGEGTAGALFLQFVSGEGEVYEEKLIPQDDQVKETKRSNFLGLARVSWFLGSQISKLNSFGIGKKELFIRPGKTELPLERQNRKVAISVGLVLTILLLVSIAFGARQKMIREKKEKYQPKLTQARHEYEEAINVFSVSPERAREHFVKSKILVEGLLSQKIEDEDLEKLKGDLAGNEGRILGRFREEAKIFLDLSLLSEGFDGEKIAPDGEDLFILDSRTQRIVSVSAVTKRSEVVVGPSVVEGIGDLAAYQGRLYGLYRDGVYLVKTNKERVAEFDEGEGVMILAYAGNLYLLDKKASNVWRYSAIDGGFATKKSWFAPGVNPDLSRIISWSIDGTIWLLNDSGRVFKYSLGNQLDFSLSSVQPELKEPTRLFTTESLEFLYLLDPLESRVVVFTKEGEFRAQYQSDKLSQARDLAVIEKEGRMIFLTGDKLFSLELKHL